MNWRRDEWGFVGQGGAGRIRLVGVGPLGWSQVGWGRLKWGWKRVELGGSGSSRADLGCAVPYLSTL